MKKTLVSLLAVVSSSFLHAGTATFMGRGVSQVAPEFVEISIGVNSQCYATPILAMQANNTVVLEIQKYLESMKVASSKVDGVATQGGYTTEDTRSSYDNGQSRRLCPGAYLANTTVRFRTALNDISVRFAAIQATLYSKFQKEGSDAQSPVTFVQISQPSAQVCAETSAAMELDALTKASENAQLQFAVFAKSCGIKGSVEITASDLPNMSSERFASGYESAAKFASPDEAPTLSFDALEKEVARQFTFTYPQTTFICGEER